jgi:hypothetical protein
LVHSIRISGPFSCTNTSTIIYASSASEGSSWLPFSMDTSSKVD